MKMHLYEWFVTITNALAAFATIRFIIWENAVFKRDKEEQEQKKRENASKPL